MAAQVYGMLDDALVLNRLDATMLSDAVRTLTDEDQPRSIGTDWLRQRVLDKERVPGSEWPYPVDFLTRKALAESGIDWAAFFRAHLDVPEFARVASTNEGILALLPQAEREPFVRQAYLNHGNHPGWGASPMIKAALASGVSRLDIAQMIQVRLVRQPTEIRTFVRNDLRVLCDGMNAEKEFVLRILLRAAGHDPNAVLAQQREIARWYDDITVARLCAHAASSLQVLEAGLDLKLEHFSILSLQDRANLALRVDFDSHTAGLLAELVVSLAVEKGESFLVQCYRQGNFRNVHPTTAFHAACRVLRTAKNSPPADQIFQAFKIRLEDAGYVFGVVDEESFVPPIHAKSQGRRTQYIIQHGRTKYVHNSRSPSRYFPKKGDRVIVSVAHTRVLTPTVKVADFVLVD